MADARQALKLLGASTSTRYPKSEHVLEVKFNIARAYYEDGDYTKAAELFTAFALAHPAAQGRRASPATWRWTRCASSTTSRAWRRRARSSSPRKLPADVPSTTCRRSSPQSKAEALGELALKSAEETGDVVEGLLKVADENKGTEIGEKALYGAFTAAREKRDLRRSSASSASSSSPSTPSASTSRTCC